MAAPPKQVVQEAFLAPTSVLTRRVEIYESDGETPWTTGNLTPRLIDGSVTLDYSRDERRSFSLILDNSDHVLQHSSDGFWYDKIIKMYQGVEYVDTTPVITTKTRRNLWTNPSAEVGTSGFSSGGVSMTQSTDWADSGTKSFKLIPNSSSSDCYVAMGSIGPQFTAGKTYTISATCFIPVALAGPLSARAAKIVCFYRTGSGAYTDLMADAPASTGATRQVVILDIPSGTTEVFVRLYNGATNSAANAVYWDSIVIEEGITSGQYYDGATQNFGNRVYTWDGTANASTSTETVTISTKKAIDSVWETQIGEFMIDSITEANFPYVVNVSGRDYTKKCLSKFTKPTSFAKNSSIESVIQTIALNCGIVKFTLPATGKQLATDYFFDRSSVRWAAMVQIATDFGYELFFDRHGYLVMREFQDPVTSPLAYILETGTAGNMESYSKAVNDTRIYNHVSVVGESSDSTIIPVSAEALNTNPSSPTRIEKIGDRVYEYASPFITTQQQAQDVANNYLKIVSLEEFELNFSGISLPWLGVGEIIQFNDPRENAGQPKRFLLSSLTIPVGLKGMSGNAKRVSVVG